MYNFITPLSHTHFLLKANSGVCEMRFMGCHYTLDGKTIRIFEINVTMVMVTSVVRGCYIWGLIVTI